jgi:hypothetical protein
MILICNHEELKPKIHQAIITGDSKVIERCDLP